LSVVPIRNEIARNPTPTLRPTIRDVAALAGVSLKTVSRVINSEAGVSAETGARVAAAIEELGFQRNDLARSLRQGQTTSTIGLVIEDAANPFYSAIVQAVERAASERGYLLITASCEEDADREHELVQALLRRRVDALLLVPAARDHAYLARDTAGTPVVFLDRPPGGIDADQVLIDNVGGGRAGTEHLLAQGHERIAFIADRETLYTSGERLTGYLQALERAGLPVIDELVRTGSHDAAQAEAVVAELLGLPAGRRPTAVFAGNNRNTVGAIRAIAKSGRPVALIGFDDFELADLVVPPVTVVRHDSYRMGARAAELAFERVGRPDLPARRVVVPTELVVRGSGEVPPS
jgi:LacI family transcriptional regulator